MTAAKTRQGAALAALALLLALAACDRRPEKPIPQPVTQPHEVETPGREESSFVRQAMRKAGEADIDSVASRAQENDPP